MGMGGTEQHARACTHTQHLCVSSKRQHRGETCVRRKRKGMSGSRNSGRACQGWHTTRNRSVGVVCQQAITSEAGPTARRARIASPSCSPFPLQRCCTSGDSFSSYARFALWKHRGDAPTPAFGSQGQARVGAPHPAQQSEHPASPFPRACRRLSPRLRSCTAH